MTTISHKRRNRGRGMRTLLLLVLCVVVAAILVVWRAPLTGLFWFTFAPLFSGIQSVTSQSELDTLRHELAATQALVADRELLAKENSELKARLGRVPMGETTLLAAVLIRPPATPYDTLILDVGLNDGVALGDIVFAGGELAIGKVTEVYRSTSRATLYSAPGQTHDALISNAGGTIPIVVEGQGSGSFTGKLPQGVMVAAGDSAYFPDLNPVLLARVSALETPPGESFETVYMQLPVNPFLLHYVEVRKRGTQ